MRSRRFIQILFVLSLFSCNSVIPASLQQKSIDTLRKVLDNVTYAFSKTIQNSPILFSVAIFTLLFQHQTIQEHPYISAFIGTDLFANFMYNLCYLNTKNNDLAKTVCQHPISTALILYSLIVNPELAKKHPFVSSFLISGFAYSWAMNVQESYQEEKMPLYHKMRYTICAS